MLRDFLSPNALRNWLGQQAPDDTEQLDANQSVRNPDPDPARTFAELRHDALENLSDAELARLGLSRGLLALRAGCPDRMIASEDLNPASG